MKKILILSMAAFLIFGFTSQASASLLSDPYVVGPITAQFYVVDNLGVDGGDGSVTLSNSSYTPGYDLKYNLGSQWITIDSNSTFTISEISQRQLVKFGLFSNTSTVATPITEAKMTFSGQYEQNSPLYSSVFFLFSINDLPFPLFAFETVSGDGTDRVSAPVPLPGAVLLLGTGLIGLVGVRRKFRD